MLGVETLLRARYGLEPGLLGVSSLDSALARLATEAGVSTLQYRESLQHSPVALQRLVEAVVVHETWFLRDAGPFELLREALRWRLERWPLVPRLRVLCLACSTGEEAWSLAMALREAGLGAHEFLVEAVDVSEPALERARAGLYPARAFRCARAQQWRDRWCEPAQGGYRVCAQLRESVRFEQANLLDPRWSQALAPAQIVFCRNVLIYLCQEARARLLALLDRLLAEGGIVFTGHAEAPLLADTLESFGPLSAFAFERPRPAARPEPAGPLPPVTSSAPGAPSAWAAPAASTAASPPTASAPATAPAASTAPIARTASTTPTTSAASTALTDRTASTVPTAPSASTAPTARPPSTAPTTPAHAPDGVEDAQRLADAGRYAEALASLERLMVHERVDPRVWLLRGLAQAALGEGEAAEHSLRRALYLEPDNEVALLALARLESLAGRESLAQRLRERAARAAERRR